jgi:CysZ protein
MSFSKDFKTGIISYAKAFVLLSKKGLGVYFLFPLFLMILYIVASSYLTGGITEAIKVYVNDLTGVNSADFFGSDFLSFLLGGIVSLFASIFVFTILSYTGGYVILIIMSPVLSILSEKTDEILTGKTYPFSAAQTMRDVVRGVLIAIRNGLYGAGIGLLLVLSMLLPVVGQMIMILSPVLFFLLSSYFYGFSFIDYSNERAKRNIKESVMFVRNHKGLALSNGIVFSLFLMVPFVGSYLAAFVSVVSVVAATISVYETEK